jgi:tryptophan synthase alpha chain
MKLGIYYTLGDGGIETSLAILTAAAKAGATLLEVGLPFSDPLLDGPAIQASHHRALAQGEFSWNTLCGAVERLRREVPSGTFLSLMTSSQLLYDAQRSKQLPPVDGVLVTDVAWENPCPLTLNAPRVWFLSQQVALGERFSEPPEPISMVYLTRVQGITGADQTAAQTTAAAIARVKERTSAPLWLGFGLSTADDLRECARMGADGGIVGSAFVAAVAEEARRLAAAGESEEGKSAALAQFAHAWVRQILERE